MIIVYHNYNKVVEVVGSEMINLTYPSLAIPKVIKQLALGHPDDKIVWCDTNLKSVFNISVVNHLLHHNNMLLSYGHTNYFDDNIGYVEAILYGNVNKKVPYATWQMSAMVGCTSAEVLMKVSNEFYEIKDFSYFLNSVAKVYMPLGLLCYSEPRLIERIGNDVVIPSASVSELFRFVKEHYKSVWCFLLLLNFLVYEKQMVLGAFLKAFFYKKRGTTATNLSIEVFSTKAFEGEETIDVIIPTIGRKDYLYDVLLDLKAQTHLPVKVIIVEQNPLKDSVSELNYLVNENWPFIIEHVFTHQTGACNARNIALNKVTSNWVFLNDDDNRFDSDLIAKVFNRIKQFGLHVMMASYCKPSEEKTFLYPFQPPFFGSGNSFMKSSLLTKVSFDLALEFGYGEDTDFGLQLRNLGEDVIYMTDIDIVHLNAPKGGFRTKFAQLWDNDILQPKPSPTIMYVMQKYCTYKQLLGYKTTLCIKFYKDQDIKNPIAYLKNYKKRWNRSLYWANQLNKHV